MAKFLTHWKTLPITEEQLETALKLLPAMLEWVRGMKEMGKLLNLYSYAGRAEGIGLWEAESIEELSELLAKNPYVLLLDIHVTPLVDFEFSAQIWKKILEAAVC